MRWTTQSPFSGDKPIAAAIVAPDDDHEGMTQLLCYASSIPPRGRYAELAAKVKGLAALPFFYRLNSIRQLATTSFSVNIEANHNRLAHCLGVTDCAASFLEVIEGRGTPVSEIDATAILVFAFLHDSYHGPFGHMLDMLRDVLWDFTGERADKFLLTKALERAFKKREGPLWTAVHDHIEANEQRAVSILERVYDIHRHAKSVPHFATEIVDAAIDADRLDYLWRDAQHLMLPSAWTKDEGSRIVGGVRVINEGSVARLHFNVEHRPLIEKLLEIRKKFYSAYYENPIKHVLEEMFTHAIYYALSDEGVLGNAEFAETFSLLVDDDLVHFLSEVLARHEHLLSHMLLQDVLTNRPFEVVWKRGIRVGELRDISLRYANLQNVLKSAQERLKETLIRERRLGVSIGPQVAELINQFAAALEKEHSVVEEDGTERLVPPPEGEQLFWLQNLYGNSFKKKLKLEQLLWSRLTQSRPGSHREQVITGAIKDLVTRIVRGYFPADAIAAITDKAASRSATDLVGVVEKQLEVRLRNTPLVFVSLSWIPGCSDKDLLAHARGFGSTDVRFHHEGKALDPTARKYELTFKDRDEDYITMVSAPSSLLQNSSVRAEISACFEELLKENAWLPEDMFA